MNDVFHYVECEECCGEGSYTILNAYDETYRENIKCEHCSGSGKLLVRTNFSSKKNDKERN